MVKINLTEIYLSYLNDQVGPPLGGPPGKAVKLKACGAEQTDEECPTTARTKKFEKDEAKVGTVKELDIAGKSIMYQSNPRSILNTRLKKILKAKIRDDDDY